MTHSARYIELGSMVNRRGALSRGIATAVLCAAPAVRGQDAEPVVLAVPGPGSSVSAMPELAQRLGADRAEGLALRFKFTGGGGIAIRELRNGNAAFGVFGLSAAMHENLGGRHLVALAALEDRVPLSLMVRASLKGVVRSVADLRGRAVGVHASSLSTVTNSQQVLRLLLRQAGVAFDDVRLVAAGQTWESQAAALRSGVVDATVSEEPFGLRQELEGLSFGLVRLGRGDRALGLPGEGFLRGTLISTAALVERQPHLAERMVRVMQRALAWRLAQGPDAVVAQLGQTGAAAEAFATMLRQYPRQFSSDGRFSTAQLAETELFFRESLDNSPEARALRIESMVVDRWAGRKP
ncbi:MAG: hypothetical protein RJA10_1966 [Pseudomonadota bacterium]